MYSIELLGPDGVLCAARDFEDINVAANAYAYPGKYFSKSEFETVERISFTGRAFDDESPLGLEMKCSRELGRRV